METDRCYIKVEGLQVGYKGKLVVKEIDIELQKGEILSLIGPNGAGKTTILKSVICQLEPLHGVVCLENIPIQKLSHQELAQKLSVLLTDRIRTEMITVEEVVATGRYPYTGRFGILGEEDKRIVANAMKLTRVEDLKKQDFMKISDGQKQRVMLARALAQEPEILVLDEPTSFLDMRYKLEFLSILRKLSREKEMAIIISLHEVELAERISDKIASFKNGRMDRFGRPREVLTENYLLELYDIDLDVLTSEFKNFAEDGYFNRGSKGLWKRKGIW